MFEPIERHREDVLHAWHLARTLHGRVPREAPARGEASFRDRVRQELDREPAVLRRLEQAAEAAPSAQEGLRELALAALALGDRELALLGLDLGAEAPLGPERLASMLGALRLPGIAALAPAHRRLALRISARGAEHPAFSRSLEAVLKHAGFASAGPDLQEDLLTYLLGPELSPEIAPMRRSRMGLWWAERVRALTTVLRAPSPSASLFAERLRDFLHAPAADVVFLDATARNGHAVVVIGDPAQPSSPSYGRRWVLGKSHRPVAQLRTPDPSCHSRWTRPMSDASIPYHGERWRISRHEERQFVGYLERAHVFSDDLVARKLGFRRTSGAAGDFLERMKATLLTLVGGRTREPERNTYLAGRPSRPRPARRPAGRSAQSAG